MAARILVIGDAMVDLTRSGFPARLAEESGAPVLLNPEEKFAPGGAANVAVGLARSGYEVLYLGVAGTDYRAELLNKLLVAAGVQPALYRVEGYKTIVKERIIVAGRTAVRLDSESAAEAIPEGTIAAFEAMLGTLHSGWQSERSPIVAIVIVDHGKGLGYVAASALLPTLDKFSGTQVFVDGKAASFVSAMRLAQHSPRVTFKCNEHTAFELSPEFRKAVTFPGEEPVRLAAADLLERGRFAAVAITRGRHGAVLAAMGPEGVECEGFKPHGAVDVADPVGAGDAFMTAFVDGSLDELDEPSRLVRANTAGYLCVQRAGAYVPTPDEVDDELVRSLGPWMKRATRMQAVKQVAAWRRRGQKVAVANGCFDLLHPGHLQTLATASQVADRVVVLLNDDDSVRRLKGPDRPVCDWEMRATSLSAVESVSLVVPFDGDVLAMVKQLRPDFLVKGAEYVSKVVDGADWVATHGGDVIFAPMLPEFSTTANLARLKGG